MSTQVNVADLIDGMRRRAETDEDVWCDVGALEEILAHPSGLHELVGVIRKACIDRRQAADALEVSRRRRPDYCPDEPGDPCSACGATQDGNDAVGGACQARNSGPEPRPLVTIGLRHRDTGEWI